MDNKKIIVSLAVSSLLLASGCGFGIYKYNYEKKAQRFYIQGMNFFNKDNYSDAYYNFQQIKPVSNYYQLALLKEFQCAMNLQDKKTAHEQIKKLVKFTKDKDLKPYLLYNEVLLDEELNTATPTQIYKKLSYITKNYENSNYAIASEYKLAKLIEAKDKTDAKNKYIKYLSYAPNGKYSKSALEKIEQLQVQQTKEDARTIAIAYFSNSMYEKALNNFIKTDFENNWNYIAKCYRYLGNRTKEKETIYSGLLIKKSTIEEKEISKLIDRLAVITQADKLNLLQTLYSTNADSYAFPTITYKLAQKSPTEKAMRLYESIYMNYPKSYFASNSLWEVFWYTYKLGRYQSCIKLANYHKGKYAQHQDAPRIQYWLGKSYLKARKTKEAKTLFNKIIEEYPLSYYAFLSHNQLKNPKGKKHLSKKLIPNFNFNSINKTLFKDNILLSQLAEFEDYQTIDNLKTDNEYIKSWIAYKKENYPASINLAKEKYLNSTNLNNINDDKDDVTDDENGIENVSFNNYQLKLLYPILFENFINKSAKNYNQSPYLFLSLVREESHFNKNARSYVGATGLSQLMPDTAKFIEKAPVSQLTLTNPEKNIEIGLKYFNYLVNFFNGNEYLAILSYNAGPGNVKKWINNSKINTDELDDFVENIPYLETKNYIKKILSSYWIYINVYSKKPV